MMIYACILLLSVLVPLIQADTCLGPTLDAQAYTSVEALATPKTAFIVEFSLKCKNGLKDLNLFAQVNGQTYTAVHSQSGRYQVSWIAPQATISSGQYEVRIFDEDGYTSLRKAQRSGEETATLKPLGTVNFEHTTTWGGPIVSSEFIAVSIAAVLLYFVHSAKSSIQH